MWRGQGAYIKLPSLAAVVVLIAVCLSVEPGQAQSDTCTLRPDKNRPNEQVLHCGDELTIVPAPGTVYHPVDAGPGRPPASVQLDSGALFVIFNPGVRPRDFQILTPLAIATVRGTVWAVEAEPGRTSVFVQRGAVSVSRVRAAGQAILLRRGQGVDVDTGAAHLQLAQWKPLRVRNLLARFGR
jgi:hypothetical protein